MIEFFEDDLHLPFIKRKKVCGTCNKEKFLYEYPQNEIRYYQTSPFPLAVDRWPYN